jgi:hypothetical protein
MFLRDTPLGSDEVLDFFFGNDSTFLVTASENGKEGTSHWSPIIPVTEPDLFSSPSFRIRLRKSSEMEWLHAVFGLIS